MASKYPIKAMTVAQVLDTSVKVLQDNFKSFLLVTLFIAFPASLAKNIVQHYTDGNQIFFGLLSDEEEKPEVVLPTEKDLAIHVLDLGCQLVDAFVIAPLTYGALLVLGSALYLGTPMTPWAAFKQTLARVLEVDLGYFCYVMLMLLGFLLLLVPGIYFALRYFVMTESLLLENSSIEKAFRRSGELTKDRLSDAMWLSTLISLISIFAVFSAAMIPVWQLQVLSFALVNSLLQMVGAMVGVVFYYSCRCKLEDFDVHYYAQDVGGDADGAVPAEAPVNKL